MAQIPTFVSILKVLQIGRRRVGDDEGDRGRAARS